MTPTTTEHPPRPKKKNKADTPEQGIFKSRLLPWLFLLPSLLILAVFLYYPAIETLRLSLYQSSVFLGTERFVGLENFVELLSSPVYHQSILQTLVFMVITVTLGIALAFVLALLANRPIRGAKVYRLLLIYPYALSPAIAGTLWLFLFNPEIGLVNALLDSWFHIKPRWLDTPFLAFALVCGAAIWKSLGYNVVFYLAALQNIPGDILEAAQIDGAGSWQRIRYILLPMLSPMTFFLVFTNIVQALFDSFGLVDILTRGGPVYGQTGITSFLIYQLYLDGFSNAKTGFAAAQAVLMLILVGAITVLQFRTGGKQVHHGA
ncbi:carbohydrate ABC transporter permease [Deinococcus cellulosilyticus]|uniref:Glycerol-3-phosphate transporter permease n=1 Tax=Deinococcus cellulosilyticus (strain DSM 18568 / NBRC 106333 / KACC 11606 / 5516J-15) TaxID=1223518 RepID=A0A511N6C7_DEIC1|nr:sugar ABC transporter permease [Deinococcus cellulosilyticus]GEM48429.1 glycerol-3-phosphate transporter permease [Deinococcus cellulosilyticus NBRC 106333 = KACC 11606]